MGGRLILPGPDTQPAAPTPGKLILPGQDEQAGHLLLPGQAPPLSSSAAFMAKAGEFLERPLPGADIGIGGLPAIADLVKYAAGKAKGTSLETPASIASGVTGAVADVGKSLTSPANLGLTAATMGLGTLPGVAGQVLSKLTSLGFGANMLYGAYQQHQAVRDAMDRGDTEATTYHLTHMLVDTGFAGLSGLHAAGRLDAKPTSDLVEGEQPAAKGDQLTPAEQIYVQSALQANLQAGLKSGSQAHVADTVEAAKEYRDASTLRQPDGGVQQAPLDAAAQQGQPPGLESGPGAEGARPADAQGGGAQAIRDGAGAAGGEGAAPTGAEPGAISQTGPGPGPAGATSSANFLALSPEERTRIWGSPDLDPSVESNRRVANPADTAEPHTAIREPVISTLADQELANGGIQVNRPGRDMWWTGRFLGSLKESARLLQQEGHPLGPILDSMADRMSDVTKAITSKQGEIASQFINGAQKLVNDTEWQQVSRMMEDPLIQPGNRPPGIPDHVWTAFETASKLDEGMRQGIIASQRKTARLLGFSQQQAETFYPDTWGMQGQHYPRIYPGSWAITEQTGLDAHGNPIWEPILHDEGWRAESEWDAKRKAQAYLQANPNSQIRIQQDQVSLPGKNLADRAKLRDIADAVKDGSTTLANGGDPADILRDLYEQSAAAAYGPVRIAKRQFGPALQREADIPGYSRDIDDFKNYLMQGQRFIELSPARIELMKARNAIATVAGAPIVQKVGEMPSLKFNVPQYGNILARVDSAIEGLEGHPGASDAWMRNMLSKAGMDPNTMTNLFRPLQSVVALLKLGFSPVRVFSHGLQTLWAVYPVLGANSTLDGLANAFNPQFEPLITELAATHSGNMSDIEGMREYGGAYFGRGSTPIDWTKGSALITRDLGMLPFTFGIDSTRRIAAVGGYLKAIDDGMPPAQAKQYARDIMDRTTGIFSASDNPAALRQLPPPVAQFKGFMLKTLQFMYGLRGAEIPRFLGAVAALGIVGMPFMRAFSNLVEQTTGENIENDLKRAYPRLSRGMFGFAGVDQPSAVGFGDFAVSRPGIPAGGLLGPAASDILNIASAGMEFARGPSRKGQQDLDSALRQVSPEARRLWDESYRMLRGETNLIDPHNGSLILSHLTPGERLEMAAGLTPIRVATERDFHEHTRLEIERSKDQRGYFVDKLAQLNIDMSQPGIGEQQRSELMRNYAQVANLAVQYGQASKLAPAVVERSKAMMAERAQRDIKGAPRPLRGKIASEQQGAGSQ